MVCLDTLTWVTYPVAIPYQRDHSYAVEVYTPWVLFQIKVALSESHDISYATVRSLREGGNFTHS